MKKFFLTLAIGFLSYGSQAAPKERPFSLYPPTNGDAPVTFSKATIPFPASGKVWDFPGGPTFFINVDATRIVRAVNPYYFGCNVACWDRRDWFLDKDRVEKAKQAGIRFWRFPGGTTSDDYYWDGQYGKHDTTLEGNKTTDLNGAWAVSTDDFIDFCRQTGSEAIITANYSAARYESVTFAADMAARWVKHINQEKKFKVRYWEIGNENYGFWEPGYKLAGKPTLTGDVYARDFQTIAAAMRAADPDLYLGAAVIQKDGASEWVGHNWWDKLALGGLKGQADFVEFPEYFRWPFNGDTYLNPSNESMFADLSFLGQDKAVMDGLVEKYSPQSKGLPLFLTEINILNAKTPPLLELVNGLFMSEAMGELVKVGYAGSCFWDWRNGLDGKLKGDFGMLSSDDPSVPEGTPRPAYYAYALYSRAFGDRMVATDGLEQVVKVYPSRFSGGEMGLVIVNPTEKNLTVGFSFKGFQPKGKFIGWVLTGKGLNERQVSWNGVEGPAGGGGPFPLDDIEPYRGVFDAQKPFELPVPPCSATGIILY